MFRLLDDILMDTTALRAPGEGDAGGGDAGTPEVSGAPAGDGAAHDTSTKPDTGDGDDPEAFAFPDNFDDSPEGGEPRQEAQPGEQDAPSTQQPTTEPEAQPAPASQPDKKDESQQQPAEAKEQPAEGGQAQPSQDESGPDAVLQALEAGREQIIERLAGERFAISQEESDALLEDPKTMLPKFAANAYLDAVRTSIAYMQQMVPQMALQSVQMHTASSAAKEEFYSANSDLREHDAAVTQLARTLREMNPQMPRDQFTQRLAMAARQALGLQAPQQGGNGQERRSPVPFQPASQSKPGGAVPRQPESEWDSIDQALANPDY